MRWWHQARTSAFPWIAIGYLLLVASGLGYRVVVADGRDREGRAFFLQHASRVTQPLLRDGRTREAAAYLHEAVATGLIDGFTLEPEGKPAEREGSLPGTRPVLTEPLSQVDGWVWGKIETTNVSLYLASGYGWRWRLAQAWGEARGRLFQDLGLLLLAALASAWHARRPRREADPVAGLREIAMVAPARRLPPIASAKKPEADTMEIDGTCGRTALANYAEIARAAQDPKFFDTLDGFFTDCATLLHRYQGKVHAVQGHEILYFFTGDDGTERARRALAAARDLEQLAEERGFRLATALADGRLHGGHVFANFTLLGAPLEETAELLLAAEGPSRNVVWVAESVQRLAAGHASFRAVPGDNGKGKRHALVKLEGVEGAVLAAKRGQVEELTFHRGNAALVAVLRSLATEKDWRKETFVAVMSELRRFECRRPARAVVDAYAELLANEIGLRDSYRLSATLALAPRLLERGAVDKPLEKLFLQTIHVKDRRVRANSVEVFTLLPDREVPELRPLVKDDDNRVSANALIKAALERFDDRVIARIEERVRGGSVAHVASALYALGEIAAYYRAHDPLFLGTKTSFLRIFEEVPVWVAHPNPMIRRQALAAAQKLRDPALDAKLKALFQHCTDTELADLFGSVYGWRKNDSKAA